MYVGRNGNHERKGNNMTTATKWYVVKDEKYGVWQAWEEYHTKDGELRRRLQFAAQTLYEVENWITKRETMNTREKRNQNPLIAILRDYETTAILNLLADALRLANHERNATGPYSQAEDLECLCHMWADGKKLARGEEEWEKL